MTASIYFGADGASYAEEADTVCKDSSDRAP